MDGPGVSRRRDTVRPSYHRRSHRRRGGTSRCERRSPRARHHRVLSHIRTGRIVLGRESGRLPPRYRIVQVRRGGIVSRLSFEPVQEHTLRRLPREREEVRPTVHGAFGGEDTGIPPVVLRQVQDHRQAHGGQGRDDHQSVRNRGKAVGCHVGERRRGRVLHRHRFHLSLSGGEVAQVRGGGDARVVRSQVEYRRYRCPNKELPSPLRMDSEKYHCCQCGILQERKRGRNLAD